MMMDEHSVICDLVRPDSVPVDRDSVLTDVCGDDRFSPGVTECATVYRHAGLDSHGEVLCECLSVREYSDGTNGRDWRMCPRAGRLEIGLRMVVQTSPALPVWQGWPVRKEIASVEGFSGTSPEDVEKLRGFAEGSSGARLRGCRKTGAM